MSLFHRNPPLPHPAVLLRPVWVVGVVAEVEDPLAAQAGDVIRSELNEIREQVEAIGGRVQLEVLSTGAREMALNESVLADVDPEYVHFWELHSKGADQMETFFQAAARIVDVADVVLVAGSAGELKAEELRQVAGSLQRPLVCIATDREMDVRREGLEPG